VTDRCLAPKCGRPLKTDESKARGYGPVCWGRINPAGPHIPAPAHDIDPNQIPLMEVPVQDEQLTFRKAHRLTVERSEANTYRGECSCDIEWAWLSVAGLGGLEAPWREHLADSVSAKADGHPRDGGEDAMRDREA
jgi:hypothetical protein